MKSLILILTLLTSLNLSAKKDYFQQLCDFNPNWKKYEAHIAKIEFQEFSSDKEYIQSHLKSVLGVLSTNPTSQLTKRQLASRVNLIQVLDHYRLSGRFPINYYKRKRIPVFIDEYNTHCAVGYLLRETGNASIAQRIASVDNYVWVKDIKDAELVAWQQRSGFTLEELKLIQGAYESYLDNALTLPNRVEIPQKPDVMSLYFDNSDFSSRNIWCRGEGKDGVLNGKWVQNYAYGKSWILGWYEDGERTGQWEEYYQGTNQLCRTEHWKNDKLNGLRTRFNRMGKVIEKIYFEDGNAVTKINYDSGVMGYDSKTYVRKPIDSTTVETQIFDQAGRCIARGKELIHNPGNLQWFQNIELTALNTFSISAESMQTNVRSNNSNGSVSEFQSPKSFQSPSLVEYKKIGNWTYYRENTSELSLFIETLDEDVTKNVRGQFPYFEEVNWNVAYYWPVMKEKDVYDSLLVLYADNKIEDLKMIGALKQERYRVVHRVTLRKDRFKPQYIRYYGYPEFFANTSLSAIGKIDEIGNKWGEWRYFDENGRMTKKNEFLVPKKLLLVLDTK